jgi:hypothetical protein
VGGRKHVVLASSVADAGQLLLKRHRVLKVHLIQALVLYWARRVRSANSSALGKERALPNSV